MEIEPSSKNGIWRDWTWPDLTNQTPGGVLKPNENLTNQPWEVPATTAIGTSKSHEFPLAAELSQESPAPNFLNSPSP